ncbi:MAG: dynamin family protein [Armatimonadetes bacterium]|nr:dynamin family protein [Armatimonadota bacterium]
MPDLRYDTADFLHRAAERLRELGVGQAAAAQLERLAGQAEERCVVAVAGRVKVGKSTLVNALLGQDPAKPGVTETTATINYFRYGDPDPERPVLCHWRRTGRVTHEPREFSDGLQGNDLATLARASKVEYLEFPLRHHLLEHFSLVDLPGCGSVVPEHQNLVAWFMGMAGQLRDVHGPGLERMGSEVDAVIYVTGEVPREDDQAFLEEFRGLTGGAARAFSSIGVMAKADRLPDARRAMLAEHLAAQLKDSLNAVIPVSAPLHQRLQSLLAEERAGLRRLVEWMRCLDPGKLAEWLCSDEVWLDPDLPECPLSLQQRTELHQGLPWTAFTAMARVAADRTLSLDAVAERLKDLAGVDRLLQALHRCFLHRGSLLRCHRILTAALRELAELRYGGVRELRRQAHEDRSKLARWLPFVRSLGDPQVARELEDFLSAQCSHAERAARLEAVVTDLEAELSPLLRFAEMESADVAALAQVEAHPGEFGAEEREELRALFGVYGLAAHERLRPGGSVAERQQRWQGVWRSDRSGNRHEVAEQAVRRYGMLLKEASAADARCNVTDTHPTPGEPPA